ncbi:hypothetical protein WKI13_07525 [Teredinibacter turnerae]|uniref:hypothetical protein n=1 Tax=Teredinibacter turnerae TaxID=2426 RepID=UPI0003601CD1|nr:hypothetical protein [Teredinibacter turnerae]
MLKAKLKAAVLHFVFTVLIALCSAFLIFIVWYPTPYTAISGGFRLWVILTLVELSLGPLMSIVIYNPLKKIRELICDYALVGLVQVAALSYGVYVLYSARPLFMVFVKDRFEVVTASDLTPRLQSEAAKWRASWAGPTVLGVRSSKTASEQHELMFDTVSSGVGVHLRPKYYTDLDVDDVLSACKPVNSLITAVGHSYGVESTVKLSQLLPREDYCWLPVVNGTGYWTVILDKNLNFVKFFPIDPWELRN